MPRARSEHEPDLTAAAAAAPVPLAMHPVTGAFADPTHESAFAAQFFRVAFPCHGKIALDLSVFTWAVLCSRPEKLQKQQASLWSMVALISAFFMLGRVLIHSTVDSVRGQRIGSQSWTAFVALGWIAALSMYTMETGAACATAQINHLGPIIAFLTALVNGSHGMGFGHKGCLIGLCLALDTLTNCSYPLALLDVAGYVVGFVVTHAVEMHLRQTYAEKAQDKLRLGERRRLSMRNGPNEELQAKKERLMYDLQRLGHRLDIGDDRSAICRGLLAGPGRPFHLTAGCTDSNQTDSPPVSLPPGPPSDSAGSSGESSGSGTGEGPITSAPSAEPTPKTQHPTHPTWAELDAQFYAEQRAAGSVAMLPGARPHAGAGAASSSVGQSTIQPPSWAELAYRRFYAQRAAQSPAGPGVPPPMGQPPTWAELEALHAADLAANDTNERRAAQGGSGVEQEAREAAEALTDIGRRR